MEVHSPGKEEMSSRAKGEGPGLPIFYISDSRSQRPFPGRLSSQLREKHPRDATGT